MDSKWFKDIILLSLDSVENPTLLGIYRKICRWYSREFSTPLHVVESLDPEFVLRAYWEDRIYGMIDSEDEKAEENFNNFKSNLLKSEEEQEEESDEDDQFYKELQRQVEKDEEKAKNTNKSDDSNKKPEVKEEPNLMNIEEVISIGSEDDLDFSDEE